MVAQQPIVKYLSSAEHAELVERIRRLSTSIELRKFTDLRERGAQLVLGGHCSALIAGEVLRISESSIRRAKRALTEGRSIGIVGHSPALSRASTKELQKFIIEGSAQNSFPSTETIASKVTM